ncbi:MAG: PSD1 domain-containing protein [Planctomycetes bacterium]|nr:PSD1 domain-containing protein [Planctomycetota bacterium]
MHLRLALPILLLVRVLGAQEPAPTHAVDFGREVRPLLSEHCYACHGPDSAKRKAGLRLDTAEGASAPLRSGARAIVPGDPEASELLRRVTHADPEERMPPASTRKRLRPEQVEVLRRWIAAGAGRTPHWSLVAPARPRVPEVQRPGWDQPIDRFLLERLLHEGLEPSAAADPRTLLRRLHLTLTGLPPTPEEVHAYLEDRGADAYARAVERLLGGTRHAEHLTRFWLDAVRYADTHGFHFDNERGIWPYRDYVLDSFHTNKRFDRFTIEQLAGDLLPEASTEQVVATGFLRCNPTSAEGGMIAEEYLALYAKDRVATTATVWMGLTLGCAQCHDHKYDPFTIEDHYRLFAFFHNLDELATDENQLVPPPRLAVPSPQQAARQGALQAKVAEVEHAMEAPDPAVDAEEAAYCEREAGRLRALWHQPELRSAVSLGGAQLAAEADGTIVVRGALPAKDVHELILATPHGDLRALRLLVLPDPARGLCARGGNGNLVLTEIEVEAAPLEDPLARRRVELRAARADYAQREYPAERVVDGDPATGWAILEERDRPHELVLEPAAPFGSAKGTLLRVVIRQDSQFPEHTLARYRVQVASRAEATPAVWSAWRHAGPFPGADAASLYQAEHGPERDADATAGFAAGTVAWREQPEWQDGRVHSFGETVAAHYLWRRIESPGERTITVAFGTDDGVQAWWNGDRVLDRRVPRAVQPDQERLVLRARAGANTLLLKVVNGGGQSGFTFRVVGETVSGLPVAVGLAVQEPAERRTAAQARALRLHYRAAHSERFRAHEHERERLRAELAALDAEIPRTMVARERKERRPSFVLRRGQYDQKGPQVVPGTPAALPPLAPAGETATRLDLARWLVTQEHPLTARVLVNRLWALVFGVGLVRTAEDFGAQGEYPSHPELLDWLACEFVDSGWDVRHVLRLLVHSAAFRQGSVADPALRARDPENRLLARGPRHRLDAEAIRDQALLVSGLLVERFGGRSVKPYQPAHLWKAVAYVGSNTENFVADRGEGLYRRSLYTFWKRTAPAPTMLLFDAPSRESCVVQRARTNTPLQALALLNDVQQVEAARGLAQRALRAPGDDADRIAWAFERATCRPPEAMEARVLVEDLAVYRERFRADPAAARALVAAGESPVPAGLEPTELAAWIPIASILLNLDETLTLR